MPRVTPLEVVRLLLDLEECVAKLVGGDALVDRIHLALLGPRRVADDGTGLGNLLMAIFLGIYPVLSFGRVGVGHGQVGFSAVYFLVPEVRLLYGPPQAPETGRPTTDVGWFGPVAATSAKFPAIWPIPGMR